MGDCGIGHAIKKRMQETSLGDESENLESNNPEAEYYGRLFLPYFVEANLINSILGGGIMSMSQEAINKKEIEKILPHRGGWLLVSDIVFCNENKITATYNVPLKPPWEEEHFATMPGVLIIEIANQVAAIWELLRLNIKNTKIVLAGLDKIRFKAKVLPGDVLTICVEPLGRKKGIIKAKFHVFKLSESLQSILVCKGEILGSVMSDNFTTGGA